MAAKWANYPVFDFFKLSGKRQAMILQAYRTENQITAVSQNEEMKKIRSKSRGKSSQSR